MASPRPLRPRPAARIGARFLLPVLAIAAGCVNAGPPKRVDQRLVTGETDAASAARSVGPMVWGLGDPARLAAELPPQNPNESAQQREARLRVQFGSNVLIGADGSVTKQYFMANELGQTFLKLIEEVPSGQRELKAPPPGTKVGGAQGKSILGRMLGQHEVEVTYVPDFEILSGANLAESPQPNQPQAVKGEPLQNRYKDAPSVALALVTAQPAALAAFEASLDLFYASIQQVEISVLVLEYQTADALAFGVTQIDNNTPILSGLSSGQLVKSYSSVFPLRQPIVGASPVTDVGRFALGGIHDNWELNAVIEALEANNHADISSAPKLVVRNGGVAAISTLTMVPFPRAKISQLGTEVATDIDFRPVGVRMNIIPVIAGTNSVILQVFADVSAVTGFAATEPVTTPITSTRTALTTVYLKDGYTLVIGGLKSKTTFETETKVPLLGDIPLLGFLFRSTSTSHTETTVEFFITPRIVDDRGSPATDF